VNYKSLTTRELISWSESQSLMVEPLFAELVERLREKAARPDLEDELESADEQIEQLEEDVAAYESDIVDLRDRLREILGEMDELVYNGPKAARPCKPGAAT
jgi:FtsZ-binding cell division protein ZapB